MKPSKDNQRVIMNDIDLLRLSASTIGIDDVWFPRMSDGNGGCFTPCHYTKNGETVEWNPLCDTVDALNLALKCNISIMMHECSVGAVVPQFGIPVSLIGYRQFYEDTSTGQSVESAMCIAVTRAAAYMAEHGYRAKLSK